MVLHFVLLLSDLVFSFAYSSFNLAEKILDLPSPTAIPHLEHDTANHDVHQSANSDDDFDIFNSGGIMTGTGASSPFIKDEPDDWNFNSHNFMPNQQSYNMQMNQHFAQVAPGSIDPSELTMQNSNFGQYSFGSQQNLASSFHLGNSGIGDDELLDLDLNDTSKAHGQLHNQGTVHQDTGNTQNFFQDQSHQRASNNYHQMHQVLSNTPDGGPIQSPFINGGFNYGQFVGSQQYSQHVSPHIRPVSGTAPGRSDENSYMRARHRASLPHGMDRKPSDSRSPLTPKTPALGGLNLGGTPESGTFAKPIHTSNFNHPHKHQKSLSGQWESNSGSYVDSPLASPMGHPTNHTQISEVLRGGKPASLPAKVESHHPAPAFQSQEAKRRRRRESHNMVERRRRDNINERIQELSHLVPQHRLEDEKIRKHLANNSPLSPTLAATGMSPPPATSLLAGGGRRATGAGNITMGIPMEEKDKGPNKGDILNGSVGWTRDLMWALYNQYRREAQLAAIVKEYGGALPFTEDEDDRRMRTELMDAMEKNDPDSFDYTRGHGSGLRVPKHTNVAGEPLGHLGPGHMDTLSPHSLSPGVQSGGSGANSGGHGQPQFWTHTNSGRDSFSLKEEDEFGMEMG
ncbi:hypothetical protein MMC13_004636 [Lambiella insularis]|nr:hypothetical protein [Lambiella insularis]